VRKTDLEGGWDQGEGGDEVCQGVAFAEMALGMGEEIRWRLTNRGAANLFLLQRLEETARLSDKKRKSDWG